MKIAALLVLIAACTASSPTAGPDGAIDGSGNPDATRAADADLPQIDAAPPDADLRVWPPSSQLQQVFADPAGNHPDVTIQWPDGYDQDPSRARDLFLFLNPYGNQSLAPIQDRWGLSDLRNTHDALVLSPVGDLASDGHRYWHATGGCCDVFGDGHDSVGYLAGLLTSVRAAGWHIRKVYVLGISNGAFMGLRLACDHPELVDAVLAMSGAASSVGDPPCAPGHTPVLETHGTNDKSIRFGGGYFASTPPIAIAYPAVLVPANGVDGTLPQLATRNGCAGALTLTASGLDFDSSTVGAETDEYTYTGCPSDGAITHLLMNNSPHSPVPTPAFFDYVFQWLEVHS